MIRITARKNGFRRCGAAHPAAPTDYPNDRFTADELEQLCNEPMLVVVELPNTVDNVELELLPITAQHDATEVGTESTGELSAIESVIGERPDASHPGEQINDLPVATEACTDGIDPLRAVASANLDLPVEEIKPVKKPIK